jgi:hypothetical protein
VVVVLKKLQDIWSARSEEEEETSGWWVAILGPSRETAHRSSLHPVLEFLEEEEDDERRYGEQARKAIYTNS